MEIPGQVMARIEAIQQRIDTLSNGGQNPAQMAGSFASALQTASAATPELGPDGEPVRPLDATDASYSDVIASAAAKYNIDPKIVQAVIQVESGGNPQAVSKAGAMGLMQLMPSNVAEAGVTNPYDPAQNIDAGTKQLSSLLNEFGGDLNLALAAYNAGPNAVKRYGGIPPYPETQQYVRKIQGILGRS